MVAGGGVGGHVGQQGNVNAYSFRNNRLFDRNPTTWVPQAPMRNGKGHSRRKGTEDPSSSSHS